jgi:hypothetical protein
MISQIIWVSPLSKFNQIIESRKIEVTTADSIVKIYAVSDTLDKRIIIQILNVNKTNLHGGTHILGNIGFGAYPEIWGDVDISYILTRDLFDKTISSKKMKSLNSSYFDIHVQENESVVFCLNNTFWVELNIEAIPNTTSPLILEVDSLDQNFINLIGHNYRDKTISTFELAIVQGFNVFFQGEIQKHSSEVEYRVKILRKGVVVYASYSSTNQLSQELRNGLMIRAQGDILVIDEVLLKKEGKVYPILGVELEIL